jgi:hypothetical protein
MVTVTAPFNYLSGSLRDTCCLARCERVFALEVAIYFTMHLSSRLRKHKRMCHDPRRQKTRTKEASRLYLDRRAAVESAPSFQL